ncbi:DUF4260 domain-containing protein [Halalkalibacillus sediminis]|uniref:DUF4260 domain-containing protein n=1 Tax=Halalkalibacillus sediminis TaxID=2018042 RepID=A0A2I0QS78_9BACI|nr:DUF4260 domain-containing protein [Halalkalibacillus sediminis]PKR77168.1 DUF4260 domain-containing protein [Halalkalibacillus sediminis]
MVKSLLHLEGLFILAVSVFVYYQMEYSWLLFLILLFTPDLSMLGYIFNNSVGAMCYNLVHTYTLAILLIGVGYFGAVDAVLAIGLILAAHIGMDRMIGYGLKYPTDFKDTHLNKV